MLAKKKHTISNHLTNIEESMRKKKLRTKIHTVHTARTMMFNELSALISQRIFDEDGIVEFNVLNKKTKYSSTYTLRLLSKLYDFRNQNDLWKAFTYLWGISEEKDRRLMTLLYAIRNDSLLQLSIPVVINTQKGKKVAVEAIREQIEKAYPERFTPNTLHSSAQNVASSWKQAGYIIGKVRNLRVAVNPAYTSVLFALYLGKIDGLAGEKLLKSQWVHLLELSETRLKELVSEAAIKELITYKHGGGVVAIAFDNLINHINQWHQS